jgi:hypothetical protein
MNIELVPLETGDNGSILHELTGDGINLQLVPFLPMPSRSVVSAWLSEPLDIAEERAIIYAVTQEQFVNRLYEIWGNEHLQEQLLALIHEAESDLALTLEQLSEKYPQSVADALINLMLDRATQAATLARYLTNIKFG